METALRIFEDAKIRQSLVFDKSVLNTKRILVSWISPNSWAWGYRYGNVRFSFTFKELVADKKFFWVEAISDYNPTACRILITDQDRSDTLESYDPGDRTGPWWFDEDADAHFWNGDFCIEFMYEGDLSIKDARKVDFVDHHGQYCSVHRNSPKSCAQLGLNKWSAGAHLFTSAAARGIDLSEWQENFILDEDKIAPDVRAALSMMCRGLGNVQYSNRLQSSMEKKAGARAVLNAFAVGKKAEAKALAGLFESDDAVLEHVAKAVADSLGMEDVAAVQQAISG